MPEVTDWFGYGPTARQIYEFQPVTLSYMPVHLGSHDPDLDLTPGTTKSDIIGFLYRNDEYGYSPQEIHSELDIPHNTAKVTAKRLYDNEYIDKTPDGYYHAREDREDLYRYGAALDGLERMFADHGTAETSPDSVEPRTDTELGESAELTDEDIEDAVALVDTTSDEDT